MNNVPHESRIIMLSCTEISFVISFIDFENLESNVGKYHSTHQTAQTENFNEDSFDMLYKNDC